MSRPRTDRPRGFASDVSLSKLRVARALLAQLYPQLTAEERTEYLLEIGAGRFLGIQRYRERGK